MRKGLLFLPVLLAVFLLTGCGNAGGELEKTNIPQESIVSVYVESEEGSIQIEPGKGKTIQIEASYAIEAGTKDRREQIAGYGGENILVTTDTSNPSVLTVLSRLSSDVTLRDGESVQIHLRILVPEGIGSVAIQSDSADITIANMFGCAYSIVNNSGSITVKDSTITGKSSFTNIVGDVEMKLKKVDTAEEIRVSTDVGDIRFNCPKRTPYTATIEELSQRGYTLTNKTGGPQISLSTKVGSIKFQK
ncbi:MAG: DUF4097 domain-containing protein [Provencibacterium sp.]|nr:DUF4097 domain-containing protein [Provencibacterium sp.]